MDPLRSRSEFMPRCFFKIILSDITPQSRLMIPRMFMNACGENLADHVFLQTPARSVWKVEPKRTGHEAWLQNGWPKFAEINSLAFGHVLVFRYESNSTFRVTIMDKSATEIDYPSYQNEMRKKKQMVMLHIDEEEPVKANRKQARPGGKAGALAAANGFRSNKPYFLNIVKPSCIGINSVMRIKLECMRGFVGAEGDMVILQVR